MEDLVQKVAVMHHVNIPGARAPGELHDWTPPFPYHPVNCLRETCFVCVRNIPVMFPCSGIKAQRGSIVRFRSSRDPDKFHDIR